MVASLRTTSIVPSPLVTIAAPPVGRERGAVDGQGRGAVGHGRGDRRQRGTLPKSPDGSFGLLPPPQACRVAAIAPSESA